MPVPDYQTLMLPVLRLFAEGKESVAECIDDLKEEFSISDDDAEELLPSGRMTYLYNRAHWARTYLGKAGLLESPKRGKHKITEAGLALLATQPSTIDNKTLAQFSEFVEWKSASSDAANQGCSDSALVKQPESSQTPEDLMLSASKVLSSALRDELLTSLLQVTPTKFERLILDLLSAMGFGRVKTGYSQLTPVSGDGGIDGVINEDALGLDAVYIQAKRYAPDNKVSRPDIQRFVGSLTGESATKGVFVTTSDFSAETHKYIEKVQQRVVLINGKQLAELMIEHNIGVQPQTTYVIKSIDENYFSAGS